MPAIPPLEDESLSEFGVASPDFDSQQVVELVLAVLHAEGGNEVLINIPVPRLGGGPECIFFSVMVGCPRRMC